MDRQSASVTHLNERGVAWFNRQLYTHAKSAFLDAITIAPTAAVILYNLGRTYEELGDLDEAREKYRDAIRHSSHEDKLIPARYLIGVYKKQKNWNKALQLLKGCLGRFPSRHWETVQSMADLHFRAGHFFQALKMFEKVNKHVPSSTLKMQIASTHNMIGIWHHKHERYKKALEEFVAALDHDWNSLARSVILCNCASSQLSWGKPREAHNTLDKAKQGIEQDSPQAEMIATLEAEVLKELGFPDRAKKRLKYASQPHHESTEIFHSNALSIQSHPDDIKSKKSDPCVLL